MVGFSSTLVITALVYTVSDSMCEVLLCFGLKDSSQGLCVED